MFKDLDSPKNLQPHRNKYLQYESYSLQLVLDNRNTKNKEDLNKPNVKLRRKYPLAYIAKIRIKREETAQLNCEMNQNVYHVAAWEASPNKADQEFELRIFPTNFKTVTKIKGLTCKAQVRDLLLPFVCFVV